MARNLKLIALALLFSVASCSFTTKEIEDPEKDKLLLDLISYVIERGHFDAKDMDDSFSESVFEDYIDALDPFRRFFHKKDIEEFAVYKDKIDDMVKQKDLTFFDLTYTRFVQRFAEAEEAQKAVLSKPFDFTKNETIDTDYEKLEFAKNKKEIKERWRLQLKLNALSSFYDMKDTQTKTAEAEEGKEILSDKAVEVKVREDLTTTMKDFFDLTNELERKDYFATFLNAIVEEYDPHTNYFAPVDKDRFDQRMSGQFEGIGARLQKRSGEIHVTDIISGGPAWRQEELQAGDIILKVAQEEDEQATNVQGMRLDDAIKLIKGPKDTKVILNVKRKIDGSIKDIVITRDVVLLEETYAKSASVRKDDHNYGVINLPSFYFDTENQNGRNAATDIKEEIIRLKKQGMEGLVIDLRNNGGGSLKAVVDMAGLFIKEGPVVQVKTSGEEPDTLYDEDKGILWDGPLVILVNENSASASEILAAAMQDYKRAIIIGGKQTFGKGTVQRFFPLNRWLRSNDHGDMGSLKVTIQKFYRVNGGSTQLEGVKSDVIVPDLYSYIDIGERDQENPLPWDRIRAATYDAWDGYIDYEKTIESSVARISKSEQLKLINEYAQWLKQRREETKWDLSFEGYKARVLKSEEDTKHFDAIDDYDSNLTYASLPYELKLFKNDTILKEKRERWHKSLAKDIYVEEAINVLEDLKINNIRKSKIAAIKD
ncbi:carboxy terminal-processing peptidase [Dokdonia sp.]|uniref:carboxy terminal-processing peptidase n=1 Tax=Dokdonia sp. TaxID=2024995 RepID=UPI003267D2B8